MPKRILVIDDEPQVRKIFTRALADLPYQVVAVESGEVGIAMVPKTAFDLIFIDLKMNGLDGISTLIQLHSLAPEVPKIVVTGFHREFVPELKEVAKQGIPFDVLNKPLGINEIREAAQKILEGRK